LEGDNKLIEAMEHDTQILMNEEESSEVCRSTRAVELVCNCNHVDSVTFKNEHYMCSYIL
jgi:hypothetical protein